MSETPNARCSTCSGLLEEADGFCPRCFFLLGAADFPLEKKIIGARYELSDEIGRGRYGAVFRARQLSLNRPVALKLLLNARLLEAADLHRFRKEAETIAQL